MGLSRAATLLQERAHRRTARRSAVMDANYWLKMWADNGNPVSLRKAIEILNEEAACQ